MYRTQRQARRSGQQGSAAIEFSLVATLLFTVLFSIIDFGHLFYTNLTMQHAVREGTRYAVTGASGLATNQSSPTVRCDAAVQKIREQSMGLYDKLSSNVRFSTVNNAGAVVPIGAGNCYNASDIIVIQVDSRTPILTPFLRVAFGPTYDFTVGTTMKNERF